MIELFITFKLKKAAALLALLLIVVLSLVLILANADDEAETMNQNASGHIAKLVIDPGHGGIDGGAVSASGIKESDVNLKIADKMGAIADFLGLQYVMTRDSDTESPGIDSYSEHNDLVARAELVNSIDKAVMISVHQNEFPSAVVSGAEVMYADTDGSRVLAEDMQNLLVTQLDPENRRVFRPAPKELLLTGSINCPGVLVECGFLSNPTEAEKLGSTEYQTKIAAILIAAYVRFSDQYYNT